MDLHRQSAADPAIDGQLVDPIIMTDIELESARNDPLLSEWEEAQIESVHGPNWDSL